MIRQAKADDILALEKLYEKRVRFNDAHGIHQWDLEEITWKALSKTYKIENFYVKEVDKRIVAAVCFVDYDPTYWPELARGESYYLHKICVDPGYAKLGYSKELIEFFKEKGRELGFPDVRLDVRSHKQKLREMYESCGFELVRVDSLFDGYDTALYRYSFQS